MCRGLGFGLGITDYAQEELWGWHNPMAAAPKAPRRRWEVGWTGYRPWTRSESGLSPNSWTRMCASPTGVTPRAERERGGGFVATRADW